jgi:hypothetical protein
LAIIVVGGSGKGVGKTALVCGLIAGLPECQWTAVKITSHDYGKLEPVWEETEAGQGTDTGRYLAAGAARALLVTTRDGIIPALKLKQAVAPGTGLILESSRILTHLEPELCLGVLGPEGAGAEVKPSFQLFMRRADALVTLAASGSSIQPAGQAIPLFPLARLELPSPEMLAWVRERLRPASRS